MESRSKMERCHLEFVFDAEMGLWRLPQTSPLTPQGAWTRDEGRACLLGRLGDVLKYSSRVLR